MPLVGVEIPDEAYAKLAELAAAQERSPGEVVAELIEREAQRAAWSDAANEAYARLQADPKAWADYQAEMQSMEGTLIDGLDDDPWIE